MITTPPTSTHRNLAFVKEVAKYFMDFLETDFHKRNKPKRSIQYHNNDNILTGLNLNKYTGFQNQVWRLLIKNLEEDGLKAIKKGDYKTTIPKELVDLIKLHIGQLTDETLVDLREKLKQTMHETVQRNPKDFELALNELLVSTNQYIQKALVVPFISWLEKPFKEQRILDENHFRMMEYELSAILCKTVENPLIDLLKSSMEERKIVSLFPDLLELGEVKHLVTEFLDNLQVGDLFFELYELERNQNILDKQEFYLYLGDITYDGDKYPILYIPLTLVKTPETIKPVLDSQVYINKKALEYIVQQYNVQKEKAGRLKSITERIIYLGQHREDFLSLAQGIFTEIANTFELQDNLDLSKPESQILKNPFVTLSNACHFCLFEKSDESLVNDYEEILQLLEKGDNKIASAFDRLIDDFIYQNPQSFRSELNDEWDKLETPDRLVFPSPIPLNSEQRQILSAIKKEGCKYITIEGPPGTGKSHTITAIAFDCIREKKSVLILSDKKEALDVVEDKITQTMDTVRLDKNFQNPLLRLGRTGNTYSQILSNASVENIDLQYRAVKNKYASLHSDIEKSMNSLKEDLEAEILAYEGISIQDIREHEILENGLHSAPVELEELKGKPDVTGDLRKYRNSINRIQETVTQVTPEFLSLFPTQRENLQTMIFSNFCSFLLFLQSMMADIGKAGQQYSDFQDLYKFFDHFTESDLSKLQKYIRHYENLYSPTFGFLFHPFQIRKLDKDFLEVFPYKKSLRPSREWMKLKNLSQALEFYWGQKKYYPADYQTIDILQLLLLLIHRPDLYHIMERLSSMTEDINFLKLFLEKYPQTVRRFTVGINSSPVEASPLSIILQNPFTAMPEESFQQLIRFLLLEQNISHAFHLLPETRYHVQKKKIENLVTLLMTYLMDERVIQFYDNNKATAKALREIIKNKQKFPKEEFDRLKEAFPCIIAGIRDYAEYIPLEPDLFDLVIMDEASQVSIAQALPAFLRAKKVLILGDKKQFSNVKAAQARTDTNREYLARLREVFTRTISTEPTKLVKLEKFNIKTSVLDFFEYIANFSTMLHKYFRGYKEIISYSNKHFYKDSLQVMKIRGKPITEVLKFSYILHDGANESVENTNFPESEFIVQELKRLKAQNIQQTVGIITPHTNQQKYLMDKVSKLADADYYFDTLKLKIMTFDTCQGEERDLVYYSMVAHPGSDKLWGVFIKDLKSVNIEDDSMIKAQRLNVGFSRPRECMHFIHSKPLDEYSGSIGEALRHYWQRRLEESDVPHSPPVDSHSPMEAKVMNWLTQTEFWKKQQTLGTISLLPQFELGTYLKQLELIYNHPKYKADILLVVSDVHDREQKIIIEYDGFEEYFTHPDWVYGSSYSHYYSDDDVYREKVLESYGYKFLRLNKFNLGNNPPETLNLKLETLLKPQVFHNPLLEDIHDTMEGLQNGVVKECPKCGKILPLKDFRDKELITGYGRFCRGCKGLR